MKRNSSSSPVSSKKQRNCESTARTPGMVEVSQCGTASHVILPEPLKSENDKKKYRSLRLENGLKVLLVSDIRPPSDASNAEKIACDDADAVSDDEGEEKMAAAALAIGCGSFLDPVKVPGLAHFVEHMVFMGNKKYTEENSFDVFIKNSGGSSNAHTDCEDTQFHFEVNTPHMREALSRLAQFFISPLMKRDSMQRERQAVENEFHDAIPEDDNRREQLLGSFARTDHPMSKFMWGNMSSLSEEGTKMSDEQIHGYLFDFWEKYYRAPFMTLAVQAEEPLDTLQSWVVETFGEIRPAEEPRPKFDQLGLPWDPTRFNRLYRVVPVKERHELSISWQLPSLVERYRARPLGYISWLLGHEGHGSVLAYLKKKKWGISLEGGNGESGFEHNSSCSCFHVTVKLTDLGFENMEHVVAAIWAYMAMLRRLGPQERIFKEIQRVDEMSFRYQEDVNAQDWVQSLAGNMLTYRPDDYITGDCLTPEYDPDLIEKCQNAMLPSNCNIMVSSKVFEDTKVCDKTEFWFGTKYSDEPIPASWFSRDLSQLEEVFQVPIENTFIADDLTLLPAPKDHSAYPARVLTESHGELFYRYDKKFKLPRSNVMVLLGSNLPLQSPINAAMLDLMDNLLTYALTEEIYPATVARLNYRLETRQVGYEVRVSGFNNKLPKLLHLIVDYIAHFEEKVIDPELFEMMKKEQLKVYSNCILKTYSAARDLRLSVLKHPHWMTAEKSLALLDVTEAGLVEFARQFRSQLFVQMLVQGNVSQIQAEGLYQEVKRQLGFSSLPAELRREVRVVELPRADSYVRIASFNAGDTNTTVTNFYQGSPASVLTSCVTELLTYLLEEPTFDFLRTQEQLGYHVASCMQCVFGVLGLSVMVNCHADKFTAEHVDGKIEAFLEHFAKRLQELPEEEFETVRESLIQNKLCADVSLDEEAGRNWREILARFYLFDRHHRAVEALATITPTQVADMFRTLVGRRTSDSSGTDARRKLSIQVVGYPSPSEPASGTPLSRANSAGAVHPLVPQIRFLASADSQVADAFLSDVGEFKSKRPLYPICKIVD